MSEEKTMTQPEVSERPSCLSDEDKANLTQLGAARKTASLEAELAFTKSENMELKYKLYVSQIFMKYGLTSSDQIREDGGFESSMQPEGK